MQKAWAILFLSFLRFVCRSLFAHLMEKIMEKTHPYISGPSNVAIAGNKDASPKAIQLAYNDLKDDKEFQNYTRAANAYS